MALITTPATNSPNGIAFRKGKDTVWRIRVGGVREWREEAGKRRG